MEGKIRVECPWFNPILKFTAMKGFAKQFGKIVLTCEGLRRRRIVASLF
jgi:hypothetical protein